MPLASGTMIISTLTVSRSLCPLTKAFATKVHVQTVQLSVPVLADKGLRYWKPTGSLQQRHAIYCQSTLVSTYTELTVKYTNHVSCVQSTCSGAAEQVLYWREGGHFAWGTMIQTKVGEEACQVKPNSGAMKAWWGSGGPPLEKFWNWELRNLLSWPLWDPAESIPTRSRWAFFPQLTLSNSSSP